MLIIYITSKDFINYGHLFELEEKLKVKLNCYNKVNFKIRYDIEQNMINAFINQYSNNIKHIFLKYIPSGLAWINNLKINNDNNTISIITENEFQLHALKNKKLDTVIQDLIKDELNLNINIKLKIDKENVLDLESYNKVKEKEESEFLSNIKINNTPNNSNTPKKSNDFKSTSNKKASSEFIYGKKVDNDIVQINDINSSSGLVTIEGEVFDVEVREIKGNKKIYTFSITDYTNSIPIKIFANQKQQELIQENLNKGIHVRSTGDIVYDTFSKALVMMCKGLKLINKTKKMDYSKEKRVELHLHTQMSDMDGVSSFSDYAKLASEWGHKSIAITDHGVVQGFPEAMSAAKKYGLKVIYGMEGYLINDNEPIVVKPGEKNLDCEYVVFDIETTGFSPQNDRIIEIGAVKLRNNKIVDKYSQLINPTINIPEKIVEITGIDNNMVKDKPELAEIFDDFISFIGDSVLVAHNASFDMSFIKTKGSELGYDIRNPVLDTLQLSRNIFRDLKSHKLKALAKHLGVSLENHHRAVDDSMATSEILLKFIEILYNRGFKKLAEINNLLTENINYKAGRPYHIVMYAKNYIGLKNLYKLVSESHLKYYYRQPRIPKSVLNQYKEGLILGTACEAGELYKAILSNKSDEEIEDIVSFYDFLEIQPIGNNNFMIENGIVKSAEELKEINKKILDLGKKFNKPVVATGDVHFLNPVDEVYRRILMTGKGFSDADNQPPLYYRTTDEMLKEFDYLNSEDARKVVIENTNLIADMVEEILPIPNGTFPPIIDGAEEELEKINYERAYEIYGNPLPKVVKERLDRELNSIISNGYAVMYIISEKLVKKSLSDGYLVGSRGSVGSSFVATMSGITEVNPLPPHYVCPNCKHSEFILDGSVGSGIDMEDKSCPNCNTLYIKDGHDIPFEVFLGFEGDKEPDIDLNFAGEYQSVAHQYVEELFGEGHVFRAGTIGTIAEKTAYGFVKKYHDEKEIPLNNAEANRLVKGCTGVKRTSGQHPGGVMVVPRDKEVYDFSPIQYPANDSSSGVITTHFDYHSISGRILKLDILGHDTPTIIRMLEDITKVDVQNLSLNDKETMKIFTSTESLGITKEDINSEVGTFGIPEFGTKFVRQMLIDTQPTTFDELVRISGLSHGTDVWLNNAQELVRDGTTTLKNVISTRDDIMLYLIYNGLDKKRSFTIMEKVRKGKGLTDEDEEYMRENNIPNWYIGSCQKIKYMFPKAHAVAYVTMSFRIAYFKVHYPLAFYATYFTTKALDFDADLIVKGIEAVRSKITELEAMGNSKTAKEKNLLTVLEVALELYARGFTFRKVDLYQSDSDKFIIKEDCIIPPLKSLQGVGENAAKGIVKARANSKFLSIEDLTKRAKINKTAVEALKLHGCLSGMSLSNQLSFFSV